MTDIGSLAAEIPLHSFVGEGSEFITKDGSVGLVLVSNPQDPECMEDEEIDSISDRLTNAWRIFDPKFRVYQYMVRKRIGKLYHNNHYIVVVRLNNYSDVGPSLLPQTTSSKLLAGLEKRRSELNQKSSSWIELCSDFWPMRRATKEEAFSLLWSIFNGSHAPTLQSDLNLGEQLCGSEILFAGQPHGVIAIGGIYASILGLKFLPENKQSTAYMLEPLASVEAEFVACVQTQAIPFDKQRRSVRHAKSSQIDKETSTSGKMQAEKTGVQLPERMRDYEAVKNVEALALAQAEIAEGNHYGWFSLTISARASGIEELLRSREAIKSALDVKVRMAVEGSLRKVPAFFSMCPGAHRSCFREKKISNKNRSHFSLLFGTDCGQQYSEHLKHSAVVVLETQQHTPYYFNFHSGDVGHLLITGKTGSGKTVLSKVLLRNSQKYKPYTSITDLAGTYEQLTQMCGGSYTRVELGSEHARMSPLAMPDSKEQRDFVTALVALLMEQRGHRLDADQVEDIHQAVVKLYESEEPKRLGSIVRFLPEEMRRPMRRWVEPGQYAWLLDNEETAINENEFQTHEFIGLDDEDHRELLEPLFMAKFHMDTQRVRDPKRMGQLKIIHFDEAWVTAESPRGLDYLRGALKRARMFNTVVMLATQSPKDASRSSLWPVINQCCDKIFLADPEMTAEEYAADFGLRPKQIETIKSLIPKRQVFIRNAGEAGKVMNLHLTPEELLAYATDSPTVARRNDAIKRYGAHWMDELLDGTASDDMLPAGNGSGGLQPTNGRLQHPAGVR